MMAPKIFNFKKFMKKSGKLLPITFDKKFPITVKRIFFVYGKKNYKRGDHAHKKCSQFFFPLFGKQDGKTQPIHVSSLIEYILKLVQESKYDCKEINIIGGIVYNYRYIIRKQ